MLFVPPRCVGRGSGYFASCVEDPGGGVGRDLREFTMPKIFFVIFVFFSVDRRIYIWILVRSPWYDSLAGLLCPAVYSTRVQLFAFDHVAVCKSLKGREMVNESHQFTLFHMKGHINHKIDIQ